MLDQEIGDGDHIFNILRGLEEISKLRELLIDQPIDQIFKQLGMKIMTTMFTLFIVIQKIIFPTSCI